MTRKVNKDKNKISIKSLHKSFATKKVLQGINLDIKEGESVVVIGGSGSGKSVLLKNILGLIHPDKGVIKVDNEDTTNLSERKRNALMAKFGMLFQGGALFDSLPVWKNVSFALLQSGKINNDDAMDLAVQKLNSVGLPSDVARLFPAELSGGMQKRVSLARAIADEPEIIFFDEPTTGLDPIMAEVINDLIIKCSDELGATTLTITHDMHSVRRIADRVAMLKEGKIIWDGNVNDLDKSGNDYVQQFVKVVS